MTENSSSAQGGPQLSREQRYAAYRKKLLELRDGAALREVIEREMLLEFVRINHGNINEFPLLKAQQNSVIELMCNRGQHPGYDFIQKMAGIFMTLVTRYDKARANNDTEAMKNIGGQLHNTEAILIKCVQGIVYGMALITDNFEEMVLRYFGQESLNDYSALIEKYELDINFWHAFVEHFVASRVENAHKEILAGRKYNLSKERTFLVIRFLFDDILAQLNPTSATIEKTRLQKTYELSEAGFKDRRRAKIVQNTLIRGLSFMPEGFLKEGDFLNAARIVCIDPISENFAREYQNRIVNKNKAQKDEGDRENSFEFLLNQVVALGVGATLAIGMTSRNFFSALEKFIPGETKSIVPLMRNFNTEALEKVLFFMLEHHFMHILREIGADEGGKIMVRSARARRAAETDVDQLAGMSKIRKAKLFVHDSTRQGYMLFRAKQSKQLAQTLKALQVEPKFLEGIKGLWGAPMFRVDIMVLVNLEQVSRTTTNLNAKLAEILSKYGVSAPGSAEKRAANSAEAKPKPEAES